MANTELHKYRFYLRSVCGNKRYEQGWVEFLWDECNTRDEWNLLFERLHKYITRRNAQKPNDEVNDWSCPQWESWCRDNPLPKTPKRTVVLKGKRICKETV